MKTRVEKFKRNDCFEVIISQVECSIDTITKLVYLVLRNDVLIVINSINVSMYLQEISSINEIAYEVVNSEADKVALLLFASILNPALKILMNYNPEIVVISNVKSNDYIHELSANLGCMRADQLVKKDFRDAVVTVWFDEATITLALSKQCNMNDLIKSIHELLHI